MAQALASQPSQAAAHYAQWMDDLRRLEPLGPGDVVGTTITFFASKSIFETTHFNWETLASRIDPRLVADPHWRTLASALHDAHARRVDVPDAIAVAHHQDDSVETLLLNLIRGTGINGLRGIRPKNGHIVRPLLCLERKEIISYLNRIGQDYVTDSTNLQDEYTRNKIRLNLLPMMQEINPSVKESILNTAEHLDGASAIYKQGIDEGIKRVRTAEGICIERLMQEPAPATLLFEILYPLGFNTAQIRDIYRSLEGQPGKIFTSEHWCIVKDREYLLIEAHRHPIQPALAMEEHVFTPDFVIPRDKNTACFDADKLTHPLLLRPWRQGDSFIPFGMKGRKKVSDYMTDRKFSLLRKEQQWVLCCGEEIIWLIGERTDNRFRIGASTKRVLTVRLLPAGDSPVTP